MATDGLLPCGGLELTTFWGHALCLGARQWVDWRVRPGDGGMARIAAEARANGQVFVIAHPRAPGDPFCTGCTWLFEEVMPGDARLVEVWNGRWTAADSNNEAALALWYAWLNAGLRICATAGTDMHAPRDYAAGPCLSVIYAEELSEAALLAGLRAGHVYLSAGPRLTLEARGARGERWAMGDTIVPVEITVYEDRTFSFILKSPPAAVLLKKAAKIEKGSGVPNREKVGKVTEAQVEEIAKAKMADLNANDIEAAKKIIKGTARSMGIEVVK